MKFITLSLIVILTIGCQVKSKEQLNLTQYVDPQIGSVHGRWFFYTPAALPFGMAKLAPHTNAYGSPGSWGPCGYDDRHSSIEGFGHFHEFQIGGLVFMPTTGVIKTTPGTLDNPDDGYRSRFDKTNEVSAPGYYSVELEDYNIKAELTATHRVGYHRYTYPKGKQANLIIDIGHKQGESSDVTEAYAKLVNKNEVEGYIETYPEYVKFCDPNKRVKMYFVAKLSQTPTNTGSFVGNEQTANTSETKGINNGLYLSFKMENTNILEIQTGLSYTSIKNARLNLKTESERMDFEKVKVAANEAWNDKLNQIVVEGGKYKDRVKFYTGLYHALLGRGTASDVNGQYPLVDGGIGQKPLDENGKPKYLHINTDGMWGGFMNLSQLWSFAYPEYFRDYVQSNLDFSKDRGWLHDGAAAGTYTNGVQTNFQGLLIASAYNVNIRDFEVEYGYEMALKNEIDYKGRNLGNGKYDLGDFMSYGYVPYKDTVLSNGWIFNFGASHTLEYSFSSYAVAQLALQFGDKKNYNKLTKQANYYKNLYDSETHYIRPKLPNGQFIKDFDPMKGWDGFQEGNAAQFTWYAPHDIKGLISLMGNERFNTRLSDMFDDAQRSMFGGGSEEIHSFSGVEKLYNHGNQPCLHNPWLFNYSGKPWLSQKWTRTICNEFYGNSALHGYGIGQDEDQGQLGAWYTLAAMGLFDVQGLTAKQPTVQFGSPIFDKVTIKLNPKYHSGKELVIKTNNNSEENYYVQSVSLNSKELDKLWLYHKELTDGGVLEFNMGPEPNKDWKNAEAPPSMSTK